MKPTWILAFGLSATLTGPVVQAAETEESSDSDFVRVPVTDWQEANCIVITFDPESARLSSLDDEQIRTAVAAANGVGSIKGAAIAAWSDSSYPQSSKALLPRTERLLADKRADAVANALGNLGVSKLDLYNMAEHASWFSRTFKTADARIKGSPDVRDESPSVDDLQLDALGAMIREKGGPAKVVVALRTEMTARRVSH